MPKVSSRILNMQASPIRKLAPLAIDAESRGIKVHHLNIGQPDVKTPRVFLDAFKEYDESVLKYSESQGVKETLDSFVEYYKKWNIEFNNEDILVTNGGSEAILFAIMAVADYGDNVLMPEPFYTNYNGFAESAGVDVSSFITKAENGFRLPDEDIICSSINSKTRAIVISNPGNPTGVVYTVDEVKLLCKIANDYDLFIIADEVYREFVYDGLEFTSFMHMKGYEDRIILIDSISKRYSACGARVGLVASKNRDIIENILKLCQSRLCVPTIEQIAVAKLINVEDSYFTEVRNEYECRRNLVYSALSNMEGVICEKPTGAFYVIAKLPINDSEDFIKWLLTDYSINGETVMLAPAAGFYATDGLGKDEVRISYCINCENLKKAMTILENGLKEYIKIKL
ncbi:pyridoxal phosphate-dependent aminotransferase [Clostridium cylindrosporum]|uniref:Aminotransferase n=1 Tax=Clostridium cylindrosporum DSM 605 TaxID=1121307 RepID=A0A0J8DBP1_CLOCY|nr:pyridoxal phosphate-dependent aminotransferase [Clostridium cylindrosporum]KMT21729.1 aspartate aminotransferase AspC [Clostridium cylindrosporum DSM 605]